MATCCEAMRPTAPGGTVALEWLLDRIFDHPVVVIDTARTLDCRSEGARHGDAARSRCPRGAGDTCSRCKREALTAQHLDEHLAVEQARALGIDIATIQAQLRRTPAERIRWMEEQRLGLERLRPQPPPEE